MDWACGSVAVGGQQLFVTHDADPEARARPLLLLLHGAFCHHGMLLASAAVFAPHFQVVLIDLPGHGRSSPPPKADLLTLAAEVTAFARSHLADRPLWLIGESVGALVALAMAPGLANVAGLVIVDPPFATAKLWHVAAEARAFLERSATPFLTRFCEETLGFAADGSVIRSFVYYPLLDRIAKTVLVITGTVALGLPRAFRSVPCCMDETDLFVLSRLYGAKTKVHREPGGDHILLRRHPERCLEIIRENLGLEP